MSITIFFLLHIVLFGIFFFFFICCIPVNAILSPLLWLNFQNISHSIDFEKKIGVFCVFVCISHGTVAFCICRVHGACSPPFWLSSIVIELCAYQTIIYFDNTNQNGFNYTDRISDLIRALNSNEAQILFKLFQWPLSTTI